MCMKGLFIFFRCRRLGADAFYRQNVDLRHAFSATMDILPLVCPRSTCPIFSLQNSTGKYFIKWISVSVSKTNFYITAMQQSCSQSSASDSVHWRNPSSVPCTSSECREGRTRFIYQAQGSPNIATKATTAGHKRSRQNHRLSAVNSSGKNHFYSNNHVFHEYYYSSRIQNQFLASPTLRWICPTLWQPVILNGLLWR